MQTLKKARRAGTVLACALLMSCGGAEDSGTTPGEGDVSDQTSGGDGLMPTVAAQAPAPVVPQTPAPPVVPQQVVTAPAPAPAATPQDTGPSPWGAADGDTGEPLPVRRPMSGAARSAYQQGIAASRSGDDSAAKARFESALAADAQAFRASYNLGVLSDRAGQTNTAQQYYRDALRVQPDYERAVQGLVNILIRNGSVHDAVAFVAPIAQRYVRNLYLQAIYADVLAQADRLDESEAIARSALRRDERFVPAMLSLAKTSLRRGRKELAESVLEQAAVIDTNNAELHFLQGKVAQDKGRLSNALTEFRRAVELRPDYAEARMALGIQYMAAGNYAQALAEFEQTAKLAPTLVAVQLNLGDAYRATKQWQSAKVSFEKALRMKDDLAEAHFNMALMYMAAGAEFPGLTAMDAMQRALAEFTNYRRVMGSRLPRGDASEVYVADIQRAIERENKRVEREQADAARDAERAARQKAAAEGASQTTEEEEYE